MKSPHPARQSQALKPAFWSSSLAQVLEGTVSTIAGLSEAEAARRLARDGPNSSQTRSAHRGLRLLVRQFTSPIILILAAATMVAIVLGDTVDGLIILTIIAASASLGAWQEHSAGQAVDALLQKVQVHVEALRDGAEKSVLPTDIVVGDVVVLRAGDIVPADCRIIESHNLLINEAALTGESYPVEKGAGIAPEDASPALRTNAVFAGTHAVSGMGTAVVVRIGRSTEFGAVAANLAGANVTTGFERGLTAFGFLLLKATVVLVTAIFVVNLVLDRPVLESLLFSLALAVGLTPQMLPAIVTISLATGARRMATQRVIVKRLDAIEDIGGMTVLCVDKTGTITAGAVELDGALDLDGGTSETVLRLARLNAGLQHGFSNPLDDAILKGSAPIDATPRIDEIPYDFRRKRLSVLLREDGISTLVTKGAFESILQISTQAELRGGFVPLETVRALLQGQFEKLSADGYRVLAIATRMLPDRVSVERDDETEMVLRGLLAFHDPAKPGVTNAIRELASLGVALRLVTGDNHLAAQAIALEVGLSTGDVLIGTEIDRLTDAQLAERVTSVAVFAEVEPLHKERIVRALRASGSVVGFLGDGINDAAALHAADVGISVDTAVDVAKQSASIVLLDKSLEVVADGVRLGRHTFANTLKYIRVTTSANFGNMLSMAAASAFLPFLPLLPRQILLLNFLSDIPGLAIAGDAVDPEQVERPFAWDVSGIRNFMIIFGLLSSCFDIATFIMLRLAFDADASTFRSAWFIESTFTELAVMLVLRTRRTFFRSRPSRALLASSLGVGIVTIFLPFSPLAGALGFTAISALILATLAALTGAYIGANELAKRRL